MPKSPELYTITYDQLNKTIGKTKNAFFNDQGLTYSKDPKSKVGIGQLHVDYKRVVDVFGASNHRASYQTFLTGSEQERKDAEADAAALVDNIEELTAFETYFRSKVTPKQAESIIAHYSQGPLIFGASGFQLDLPSGYMFMPQPNRNDLAASLFIKDNEIYFESTIKGFEIKDLDTNEVVDYLKGPLTYSFKLTAKGFKFDKLTTPSKLLVDAFLGNEITPKKIVNELSKAYDLKDTVERYEKACTDYLRHLQSQRIASKVSASKTQALSRLIGILNNKNLTSANKVNQFHIELDKSSAVLTKNKDGYFKTFVKTLGLVAATILSFGLLTKKAHQFLFSSKKGSKLVAIVQDVELTDLKKPEI
jgi:hypothetical protein